LRLILFGLTSRAYKHSAQAAKIVKSLIATDVEIAAKAPGSKQAIGRGSPGFGRPDGKLRPLRRG
jgi:hypothetical protein